MSDYPPTLSYTVLQACRATGLGKTYLYELIKQGKIESRKLGKRRLISAESLRRLVSGEV